jgi:SNF2 family DNA or RNA helicase
MTTLWPHQQDALDFIRTKPAALLNMDMGTGKSAVAIRYLEARNCRRVLILCPKSVAQVWPGQFETHATMPWSISTLDQGSIATRTKELQGLTASEQPLAVIVNYDVLPYSIGPAIKAEPWDAVVLDELHKIKAPAGKISRFCSQLSDRIPNRIGLTGTVMPHSPLDVYAQFRALDKRIFGTANAAFKARYAVMGGFQGKQVVSYQNMDDLYSRMALITYRCKASEVLDLPPYTDTERYCTLPAEAARVYRDLKAEAIAEIKAGLITAGNALVKLLRLAQVANGFVRDDEEQYHVLHDAKAALLADVIEDLAPDWGQAREPVIVFGRFHKDLDAVRAVAETAGYRVGELSGRRNDLAPFQRGETDLLAVQLQSGGVGIDLTRARYCVYYSHDWSLGNYDQSRARVHRPGQTRPVTYIHLLPQGTVDVTVLKALANKRNVVDAVLTQAVQSGIL